MWAVSNSQATNKHQLDRSSQLHRLGLHSKTARQGRPDTCVSCSRPRHPAAWTWTAQREQIGMTSTWVIINNRDITKHKLGQG
jgi:hypothetical protein